MTNLVPIKVKIGIRSNGEADHPNFNVLQSVIKSGLDWAKYVDKEGSGWLYDNCCGHKEDTPESPRGIQYGLLLAPKEFADEAIARYPDLITKLDEAACQIFYEEHHSNEFSSEEVDTELLQAIQAKKSLGIVLTAEDNDAIDPTTDTRGIRKNKSKMWIDFKAKRGYLIVQ